MVDRVDREAAIAHGKSVASSSIAFWDQIRKVSFFFGDENLKRFVVDNSMTAGDVLLQMKNALGDYTYAPMTKMKEVVGYMTQLNQFVLSTSKTMEDSILSSGMGYRNPTLQSELEIMNDQKRRFIATMTMLGEWLKFQRDRINKHAQQNNGPSAVDSQYLQQQEAKKREEQIKQQQYQDWLRQQEQERAHREELEKMRQMEHMLAREREEKEKNRLIMEQKKREEEARLMESFKREQEEAAKKEEQRLQDAWRAKRESMKVEDDVKKADLMARLQKSGSQSSRPVSGRISPVVHDKQQEDLADELLKELGVTFVESKGTRSVDSSPLVRSGSNSGSPLLRSSSSIRRQSSRGSLNVDELLESITNSNPPSRSSSSASLVRNSSIIQPIYSSPTNSAPTLSSSSSQSQSTSVSEDPWDSLEKLTDTISKRHSIVPSNSSNRLPTSSSKTQLDSSIASPVVEPSITKSSLDSLLESIEAQVYPPNSPSDGNYRHSFLVNSNSSSNKEKSEPSSTAQTPVIPSLSPPAPKENSSSGPFPGLSWRDQTISSSNSIEEIMSQLSVGAMRSSMRIPPAMISPPAPRATTGQSSVLTNSGSSDDVFKKIADLEAKKKAAVADEDYTLATKLKEQIDELKAVADLRSIESPGKKPVNNAKSEIDDLIRDLESL